MPFFYYEACETSGHPQSGVLEAGNLEASHLAAAVVQLEARGLTVITISLVDPQRAREAKQSQAFHGRLSASLANRWQWLPALESMANELPPCAARWETEKLVQRLSQDMTSEQFLSDPATVRLLPLVANEEGAKLDVSRFREWLHAVFRSQETRSRRRKIWIYPLVLTLLVAAILVGFANFIIPVFREMYSEFGLLLPAPTLLTFWMAEQVSLFWLRTLLAVIACAVLAIPMIWLWRKYALTNRLFGRLVAGTESNMRAMAKLISTLAELLNMGAPMNEALPVAGRASRHAVFEKAAKDLAHQSLDAQALGAEGYALRLPPTLLLALQVPPGVQPNVALLRELAKVYSDRAQSRRNVLASSFPAMGVVILGVFVGFVLLSLFMPLVSMVTSLA